MSDKGKGNLTTGASAKPRKGKGGVVPPSRDKLSPKTNQGQRPALSLPPLRSIGYALGFEEASAPLSPVDVVLYLGLVVLLLYPPFFRGLFFPKEQLLTLALTAALFSLWWWAKGRMPERHPQGPASSSDLLKLNALDYATLALPLAYLLSLFVAANPRAALQEILKNVNYFLLYWLVSRLALDLKRVHLILNAMLASALGVALFGMGTVAGNFFYPASFDGGQLSSTLQYHNTMAAYLTAASFLALALATESETFWQRFTYTAAGYLLFIPFVFSYSRGAWLDFPIVLLLAILLAPRDYRGRTLFLAVATFLAAAPSIFWLGQLIEAKSRGIIIWAAYWAGLPILALLVRASLIRSCPLRSNKRIALLGAFLVVISLGAALFTLWRRLPSLVPESLIARLSAINPGESSVWQRFDYFRDALKIIRDHPILGAGGGGWEALYFKYQSYGYFTTQVHNHFLQVWVETGTVGFLAFLFLWGAFAYTLWQVIKKSPSETRVLVMGLAAGAFALGSHSLIDFNLSLSAVTLFLWSLFGLAQALSRFSGTVGAAYGGWGVAGHLAKTAASGAPAGTMIGTKQTKKRTPRPRGAAGTLLGPGLALLSLVLVVFSLLLAIAFSNGLEGGKALNRQDFARARTFFEHVLRFDPWTASYHMDLGQSYDALATLENKPQLIADADKEMQRALQLDKFSPQLTTLYGSFLLRHGQGLRGLDYLERALTLQPHRIESYQNLARSYFLVGKFFLEKGQANEAKLYLTNAVKVRDRLLATREKEPPHLPEHMKLPAGNPSLNLTLGQAEALLGQKEAAIKDLSQASTAGETAVEAKFWLGALYKTMGQEEKARPLLQEAFAANQRLQGDLAGLEKLLGAK